MASQNTLDRQYVESLVGNNIPEQQGVEYKVLPPPKKDQGQREEFLKDVSGMANAGGGAILYGVTNNVTLKPLVDAAPENFDSLERRLRQWIEVGIEPRITGLSLEKIDVDLGYILALRIPDSLAGPYWAKVSGPDGGTDTGRRVFKIRRGTSVSDMSYQEVRAAFDRASEALVRAANWSTSRNADAFKSLSRHRTVAVVHVIPLANYQRPLEPLAITELTRHEFDFKPVLPRGFDGSANFDGYRLYQSSLQDPTYVQVFRNGSIELAYEVTQPNPTFAQSQVGPATLIDAMQLAEHVWHALHAALAYSNKVSGQSARMLCVSVLGANHAPLWIRPNPSTLSTDRNLLAVPPFIQEEPSLEDTNRVARLSLDMIWQAYGLMRCNWFDTQGNWIGS